MDLYKIVVVVPVTKVTTILEVLNGEGKVLLVEPHAKAAIKRRASHIPTIIPGKTGIQSGLEFLAKTGKGKEFYSSTFADYFKAEGRPAHSASAVLSKLKEQGKVKQSKPRSGQWTVS